MISKSKIITLLTASLLILGLASCSVKNNPSKPAVERMKHPSYYTVNALFLEKNGEILIGSNSGLETGKFDGHEIELYKNYGSKTSPKIVSSVVKAIAQGEDYVLIGTNRGLSIAELDGKQKIKNVKTYSIDSTPALPVNNVKDIKIWGDLAVIGTYHGGVVLAKIDKENISLKDFRIYNEKSTPALKGTAVTSIAIDHKTNSVLIGTIGEGLIIAKLDKKATSFTQIKAYSKPEIAHSFVRDVAFSGKDNLLALATRGGLTFATFNNEKLENIHNYNTKNSPQLPSDRIHVIEFNNAGTKVAFSILSRGVFVANVSQDGKLSNIITYNKKNTPLLPSNYIYALTFSKNGSKLIIGAENKDLAIIDLDKRGNDNVKLTSQI